jgi:hypothetical protein
MDEKRERRRAYRREWARANRERIRAYKRQWARANTDRIRGYRRAHRDEIATYQNAYQAANRERLLETARIRSRNRTPEQRERAARWQKENRATVNVRYRRWYAVAARDVHRTRAIRRRSRKLQAGACHTTQEWLEKLELFGHCCAYCGRDDVRLTRDHRIPLIRGGTNDIGNIVPACRSCNCSKGRRTDREFLGAA